MHRNIFLFFVLIMILCVSKVHAKKKIPLQPFYAIDLTDSVPEPSGVTFCNTTNSLWMICDRGSCHYIYETDTRGNLLQLWDFGESHNDLEAVACDDTNQRIYIAEEGYMRITSFILPLKENEESYVKSDENDSYFLIELDSITVDLDDYREESHGDDDDLPGLEGLTWMPNDGNFKVANEKDPAMIVTISLDGNLLYHEEIDYADDLSGLAYDSELDLLWVLSDQNEQVFLTNLNGTIIYDYWDLSIVNPEGIAINNLVYPPEMYIVSDPSSPHGKQYISSLFVFTKPLNGTGLNYYDKHNPEPETIYCDGCEEIYEHLDEISTFISSDELSSSSKKSSPSSKSSSNSSPSSKSGSDSNSSIILSTAIPGSIMLICFIAIFLGIFLMKKRNLRIPGLQKKKEKDFDSITIQEDDLFSEQIDKEGYSSRLKSLFKKNTTTSFKEIDTIEDISSV